MKFVFIVNPCAGEGESEAKIKEAISNSGHESECVIYTTKAVGDATDYVRNYPAGEEVRFIACGGDGTINEVFNGAVGRENTSVTCYPCGSGNDFVKVFGPEKFLNIEALMEAKAKPIDLIKVGDRYSNNVTNFGFDTTVAITINKEREKSDEQGTKNSRLTITAWVTPNERKP